MKAYPPRLCLVLIFLSTSCSPKTHANNDKDLGLDVSTDGLDQNGTQDLRSSDLGSSDLPTDSNRIDLEDMRTCPTLLQCNHRCCDSGQVCENNRCVKKCDFQTEFCGPQDIPRWYDRARIQSLVGANVATTDLLQADIDTPSEYSQRFLNATTRMKSFGFPVFTRYVKNSWTEVPWPSALPAGYLENTADNLQWAVDDAHTTNFEGKPMRLGVYYRDTGEGRTAGPLRLSHPGDYLNSTYDWEMPDSWLCKDLNGVPIKQTADLVFHADYASEEFRNFTKIRLDEIARRGVDFIYFDERHLPSNAPAHRHGACFGENMKARFSGTLPQNLSTGLLNNGALKDWDNENFRKYVIHQSKILTETFVVWKEYVTTQARIRGEAPPLFVISGTFLGMFTLPYMRLSLASIADSVKLEFDNGIRSSLSGYAFSNYDGNPAIAAPRNDIGRALNIVISRDASDGRPPNLWYHSLKNQFQVRSFIAATIGYGSIANLQVNDWYMSADAPNRSSATSIENLKIGAEFGKLISPMMENTRPLKFAAILLSEQTRDNITNGGDGMWPKQVWKKLMWPVSAAFQGFVDLRIPINIITDAQILKGDLSKYKVLYSPATLPEKLKEKVRQFTNQESGILIQHDSSLNASLAKGEVSATNAVKKQIGDALMNTTPIYVDYSGPGSGTKKLHATYFEKNGNPKDIVIAMINDFRFVEQSLSGPPNNHPRFGPIAGEQIKIVLNFEPLVAKGYLVEQNKLKEIDLVIEKKGTKYELSGLETFREIEFIRIQKK